MNQQQLNQLWDDHRDGTLCDADRAAFEAHLRTHEASAAMWKAESQWLSMLREEGADGQVGRPTQVFVDGVISAWRSQPGDAASDVVGRIGWRRYTGWIGAAAAMVAVFVLGAVYSNMLDSSATPPGPPIARVAPTPKAAPDAIGLLMTSARDGYSLAAAQPARIRQGFTTTAAMLDVSGIADLFDPGVPDPAKFVEPKTGG